MKLPLPRRRIWRIGLYVLSLLLVLIAIDLILVQTRRTIHPGFETTRITAPVEPDGAIDYLTAIEDNYRQGVTPANNAAIPILQALGRAALPQNQPPDGITDRLGMPHLPEDGQYLVTCDAFRKKRSLPEQSEGPFQLPDLRWPVNLDDPVMQWLKENDKPLSLMAQATQRPRFFIPFNGGSRTEMIVEVLLPHVHLLREAGRGLTLRSLVRLQAGDVAGFREDVLAVHRLARLSGQASTLIERLIGVALERLACRAGQIGGISGKLSAQQARQLAGDVAALPDLPSLAEAINVGERYMVLDIMQVMARKGPKRAGDIMRMVFSETPGTPANAPAWVYWFVPVPYEETMRVLNRYYDAVASVSRYPTHALRDAAMQRYEDNVSAHTHRRGPGAPGLSMLSAYWPAELLVPAFRLARRQEDVARTDNRLTQIALALAAFHADHNAYAQVLTELAPAYLTSVPDDLFSDKPPIYKRRSDGYTLYSIGPNMHDDRASSTEPADDLVVTSP